MDDDILQQIEHDSMVRHEGVRQFLLSEGRPDLVAGLDAKMQDIRLGFAGAGSTWQSISEPQRRVILALMVGRCLRRRPGSRTRYDAVAASIRTVDDAIGGICGIATVRNLTSRELLAVDGGAFDPEAKIVLTERGMFVATYGPRQPRI